MSTTTVPALMVGLVDDAAIFPPGSAAPHEAIADHREHRTAWYSSLVGPLLIPSGSLDAIRSLVPPGERLAVGVVGHPADHDDPACLDDLRRGDGIDVRQVEAPVAKRGEDPMPGLARLLALTSALPAVDVYAEIPLTWGLSNALDALADANAAGARVRPKFRTGGLAAELFPTPVELAAVICSCRDRGLPFKLTAGLHRAIRHNDPETGFGHHGLLNVLVASIAAADGDEVAIVAAHLASTDRPALTEFVRSSRNRPRPLWTGFGSYDVAESVSDLCSLGLLAIEAAA